MVSIERELDRYLTLLRNKIHEKGFTQLEVQEALGWGRSYISQLLTKQKSLRLEQILSILHVIRVDPREFFTELHDEVSRFGVGSHQSSTSSAELLRLQLEEIKALLNGLTKLLLKKGLITAVGLSAALQAAEAERTEPN